MRTAQCGRSRARAAALRRGDRCNCRLLPAADPCALRHLTRAAPRRRGLARRRTGMPPRPSWWRWPRPTARRSWASTRARTPCPAAAASCRRCALAAPASRATMRGRAGVAAVLGACWARLESEPLAMLQGWGVTLVVCSARLQAPEGQQVLLKQSGRTAAACMCSVRGGGYAVRWRAKQCYVLCCMNSAR